MAEATPARAAERTAVFIILDDINEWFWFKRVFLVMGWKENRREN